MAFLWCDFGVFWFSVRIGDVWIRSLPFIFKLIYKCINFIFGYFKTEKKIPLRINLGSSMSNPFQLVSTNVLRPNSIDRKPVQLRGSGLTWITISPNGHLIEQSLFLYRNTREMGLSWLITFLLYSVQFLSRCCQKPNHFDCHSQLRIVVGYCLVKSLHLFPKPRW